MLCTHHCWLHHPPQSLTSKHPFFYTRGEKKTLNLYRNQPLFRPPHTQSAALSQTWLWEHPERQEHPNEGNGSALNWMVQPSEPEKQPNIRFWKRKGSRKPHREHLPVHQNLWLISLHNTSSSAGALSHAEHPYTEKTLQHSQKIMCKQKNPGSQGRARSRKTESSNNWFNPPKDSAASWHCWHLVH